MQPFHYGSHYSNAGIVTHFLLRIEPYTTQAIQLQGGSFDVADRLFFSIELAWSSCKSIHGDVKEIIPELFYNYFVFHSPSQQVYGTTQAGKKVCNVEPPK